MLSNMRRITFTPARWSQISYTLIGLLTLLLVGQFAVYRMYRPAVVVHPVWNFQPKTVAEMKIKAENIVTAEVIKVERGDDIITKVEGEPNGEDRIPTQKVTLKVGKSYKGAESDGIITLFQTGGQAQMPAPPAAGSNPENTKPPIAEASQVVFAGDPPYQVGEQYLLFLESGPQNMQRIVSPEGRYKLESNGTLSAMVDGDVAKQVKDKPLADVERQHGLGKGK